MNFSSKLLKMSVAERTCRTCGKVSEANNDPNLLSLYNGSVNFEVELKMILQEFELWNLNISQNDGLPQRICLTCFDSFCQIHNFRALCIETQMSFGEMCTRLDIIIKEDYDNDNERFNSPENLIEGQMITVQEYFSFPGDNCLKATDSYTKTSNFEEESLKKLDPFGEEEEINQEICESKQYRCEFCMEIVRFCDPEHLNQHLNEMHSSNEPYTCPKCDKRFDDKAKRNKHALIHYETTLKCKQCGKKVRGGKMMMADHFEYNHFVKDRECPTCGKKFEMVSLRTFNYHLSLHDDSKLHKCKFCNKKFLQTTHLLVHEKTHNGEYPCTCSQCGLAFPNSDLLSQHIKTHATGDFDCPECSKKCANRGGLNLHMQIHKTGERSLHCDICNKTYGNGINLRLHNYQKHGGPSSPAVLNIIAKRKIKKTIIKPYKCEACSDTFVLHTQLIRHLKIHEENRPYSCHLCSKPFKREAHLKLHMDARHFNRRPHKCSICGWAFPQKNTLREHFAAKHSDRRDFKCNHCPREFATKKCLKTHMMKHSEKKPFVCTVCNTGFKKLSILKTHMARHLRKNEADILGGDITDIVIDEEEKYIMS